MTQKSVYLETSFISYLTSQPSCDLITAGHQAITREWWNSQKQGFAVYVSEPVRDESMRGNPKMAAKRLAIIDDIESLAITEQAILFGEHNEMGRSDC